MWNRNTNITQLHLNNSNIDIGLCTINERVFEEYEIRNINFALPSVVETFVGRNEEMKLLESLFFNKHDKQIPNKEISDLSRVGMQLKSLFSNKDDKKITNKVVISGLPGVGKSELAKQFAKKCQNEHQIEIYWIKSGNEIKLKALIRSLKKMPKKSNGNKYMFILDNPIEKIVIPERAIGLNEYLFLITSQKEQDWGDNSKSLPLHPLKEDFAIDFYKKYLKEDYSDEHLYVKLTNLVGCSPLGLKITASNIRNRKKQNSTNFLETYIEELDQTYKEIYNANCPPSTDNYYRKNMLNAIINSVQKIKVEENVEVREFALNALYVYAHLSPGKIEVIFFLNICNIKKIDEKPANKNDEDIENLALKLLQNLSLINFTNNESEIYVHSFVQDILRVQLSKFDSSMEIKSYFAFLKLLLVDRHLHISSILKSADSNVNDFYEFFLKDTDSFLTTKYSVLRFSPNDSFSNVNKNWDLCFTGLQIFLKYLINFNCIDTLTRIFDNLENIDPLKKIINQFELLKESIESNNLEILNLLLGYNYDIDVNSRDEKMRTSLHVACFNWNLKAVGILLDRNADLEVRDSTGSTALFAFFRGGISQENVNQDTMNKFLNLLQIQKYTHIINNNGETLLHEASASFQEEAVNLLVNNYKIDVNITDKGNWTPIHEVIFKSRIRHVSEERVIKTIKTLISCNVPMHIQNSDGMTALEFAKFYKLDKLVPHLEI